MNETIRLERLRCRMSVVYTIAVASLQRHGKPAKLLAYTYGISICISNSMLHRLYLPISFANSLAKWSQHRQHCQRVWCARHAFQHLKVVLWANRRGDAGNAELQTALQCNLQSTHAAHDCSTTRSLYHMKWSTCGPSCAHAILMNCAVLAATDKSKSSRNRLHDKHRDGEKPILDVTGKTFKSRCAQAIESSTYE